MPTRPITVPETAFSIGLAKGLQELPPEKAQQILADIKKALQGRK